MKNEPLFYGLDSTMILVSVLAVTILHPFYFFPALKPRKKF